MRLGVLDVGSNTVHLLVVEARAGSPPESVRRHKTEYRLAELVGADGSLGAIGRSVLLKAVRDASAAAVEEEVDDLLAFATSAIRDATDGEQALDEVRAATGVALDVLPGRHEAEMTFLAVRRWLGWSAGRLLCLDIGGGSLEIAGGIDETPDLALSLPLGAGRLTREYLPEDPPRAKDVARLRELVRRELKAPARQVQALGEINCAVGTSKTFRTLCRLEVGHASDHDRAAGPYVTRKGLERTLGRLTPMSATERAALPGVSRSRAHQLLAGAVVGLEAMQALGLQRVQTCPWALREGVVLRRLDWLRRQQ